MIPLHILSKFGNYEVEIGGVNVKVSVIDHAALIDDKIHELTSLLQRNVVGVDVKFHVEHRRGVAKLLILCVENRCLVIQLAQLSNQYPDSLKKFLSNETICFVSFNVSNMYIKDLPCLNGVEVGELAARVLKNPKLLRCVKLEDLVSKVGVSSETAAELLEPTPKWNARVYSEKEIINASHKAYTCYVIGSKMLDTLYLNSDNLSSDNKIHNTTCNYK
ncbi:hypothetical protein Dsin_023164 [Dipteronia sinensis]|uniref:3'-5' exonuclease domain-containing protein n=1 Tax=Dipteronia sinensis TaxID=43782 RepID=A0AAE0E0S6_9ROSI|nr:hypothetical protein Dsin_023164 [Dipteronia sinensis]